MAMDPPEQTAVQPAEPSERAPTSSPQPAAAAADADPVVEPTPEREPASKTAPEQTSEAATEAPSAASQQPPPDPAPSAASIQIQNQSQTQVTTVAPAQTAPAQPRPPVSDPRDRFYRQSLGQSLNTRVKQARVLLVGAGGIGCELLKNLVLSGFGEIQVVDLDTIDLSNLNRQFLFRHEHIKKPKAIVAKEAAQTFNPKVKIVAHHANIKDAEFNVRWFRDFTVVFNALDNLEARRHVNKMCLAASVPLIESGTTGFNGNVQVIKKGVTACYDCTEKPVPKSFPVCTIRSTPSQPIHCIVWAKSYLLSEIFGTSEDEAAYDHSEDSEKAEEIAELKKEAAALRLIRDSLGTDAFPGMLFDKVFNSDIARLVAMEDMWKSRRKPEPLDYKMLLEKSSEALASIQDVLLDGQRVWTLEENLAVLNDSIRRLGKRMLDMRSTSSSPEPVITFDKDDEDTLDFVTAASNIRSSIFGIPLTSRFDVKEMAGNIIPAIATTNAIVAGLCVLESFKVLKDEVQQTKELFLAPSNLNRLVGYTPYRPPDPRCPVCSVYQVSVAVDLATATLNHLVEDFVKLELGYGDREFAVNNDDGPLYDPDETVNLTRKLSELGIKGDTFLTVIDEDEEPYVNVIINIEELPANEQQGKPVQGLGHGQKPLEIPRKPAVQPPVLPANGTSGANSKRPIQEDKESSNGKRPRAEDESGPPQTKKAKTGASVDGGGSSNEAIIIIDDEPDHTSATVILDD